jgi:hypothetical protein
MNRIHAPLKWALLALTSATLISCGGGGSSTTTSTSSGAATISGVAATGAPIAGATIILTDVNGKTATTTAGADGSYNLDVTGLTAPFVVVASGAVGDAQTVQTSVLASAPAAGASSTVNINPLTNAIVTALTSASDPSAITSSMSSITAGSIASATSLLNQALGGLASAAGAGSSFNPISDLATANGTGFDRLLDNLSISNQPKTGAILFAKDGVTVDDMAATSAVPTPFTPSSNTTLVVSNTSNSASALPDSLKVRDYTVANFLQAAFNACFAVANSNSRSTNSACMSLGTSDYKNNGKTLAEDLSGWMTSSYDGATFSRPQIIRFYTPTRALVKISGTRADGIVFSLQTVLSKLAGSTWASAESSSGTWQLTGNQRDFGVRVTAEAMRQIELNPNYYAPSGYFSSLNFSFDITVNNLANTVFAQTGGDASNPGVSCSGSACSYVNVTGPGLPVAGIFLKRANITNTSCNTTLELAYSISTNMASAGCTNLFNLNGIAIDPTKDLRADFNAGDNSSRNGFNATIPNYLTTGIAATDAIIASIPPFAPYVFKIYDGTSGNTTYIVEHLRGRPPTTSELASYKWLELSQATIDQMSSAGANPFPGGTSINISWNRSQAALPAYSTYTQFQSSTASLVSLSRSIPTSASVGLVSATITNTSGTFPAAPTANTSGGGRSWIGLSGKDINDTVIYSAWSYDN